MKKILRRIRTPYFEKERFWLTPPDLYRALDSEFHFDFDPCPHPCPDAFDGLLVPWGYRNYVNPPFRGGLLSWARKAVSESQFGKTSFFICPTVQQRTMCFLGAHATEIRFLGHVRWLSIDTGLPLPGPESNIMGIFLFVI